jgi:hypothetical protein
MLRVMLTEDISLEQIDQNDELFRISEELDSAPLMKSLREIGQLNPILLLQRDSRNLIVCGFRRVHALRKLGTIKILARILTEETCDAVRAFMFALHDNLSQRQLDPLEKARVLFTLQTKLHVPDEAIVHTYLPMLGLNPHESVLRSYLLIHGMHPVLRACVKECRLTHTSVETIAEMPPAAQDGIAYLMSKARLSASLQKKVLDLLIDISANTGDHSGVLLNGPELTAVLNDPHLSAFQKGEKVHENLYHMRNPRLSATLDQFMAQKESLQLPGSIRITAHPFFEEPGLHVEFDAPDAERFRDLVDALQKAGRRPELEKLFTI